MKKKTNNPAPMRLTDAEISALSCALDFLAHCDGYAYDTAKFDHNDASKLAWSIEDSKAIENRKGLRIAIAAIDLSLLSLKTASPEFLQVSSIYPDLIPDLRDAVPVLESLRPRLVAHAAKH